MLAPRLNSRPACMLALLLINLIACSQQGAANKQHPCVNSRGSTCLLPISYVFAIDARTLSSVTLVTSGYLRRLSPLPNGEWRYALFPSSEMALHAVPEYRIELLFDDRLSRGGFDVPDGAFVRVTGRVQSERIDRGSWASMRLTELPREVGIFPIGAAEQQVPVAPPAPASPTS